MYHVSIITEKLYFLEIELNVLILGWDVFFMRCVCSFTPECPLMWKCLVSDLTVNFEQDAWKRWWICLDLSHIICYMSNLCQMMNKIWYIYLTSRLMFSNLRLYETLLAGGVFIGSKRSGSSLYLHLRRFQVKYLHFIYYCHINLLPCCES